jgi:hypothetical protein
MRRSVMWVVHLGRRIFKVVDLSYSRKEESVKVHVNVPFALGVACAALLHRVPEVVALCVVCGYGAMWLVVTVLRVMYEQQQQNPQEHQSPVRESLAAPPARAEQRPERTRAHPSTSSSSPFEKERSS